MKRSTGQKNHQLLGEGLRRQDGGAFRDKTMNRLKDMNVDDLFERDEISSNIDSTGLNEFDARFNKNPFVSDVVSEIADQREKDVIFNHSLKKGLFNDIKNSPLRERMPVTLQTYDPAFEKHLFYKQSKGLKDGPQAGQPMNKDIMMQTTNNARFKKFAPRASQPDTNAGLSHGEDFTFNPTKFYCQQHSQSEIEFCCEITNTFYCKKCQPDHAEHRGDKVLATIPYTLQQQLVKLKMLYYQKKETLVTKLDNHQEKVEHIFQIFYDTLDKMRNDMLEQEYSMRGKMDSFEGNAKQLISRLKTYSLIEFYHEEKTLNKQVSELRDSLDDFNIYLPKTQVIMKDEQRATKDIIVDMRERLAGLITKVNHDFALENYEYVMTSITDKTVQDIYKILGPFDHYSHHDVDDDMDTQRQMKSDFESRKSGCMYRGQIGQENSKPDGIGFKVYPNNALFEGFFEEGQINGYGRGITSRGEVYQGPFLYDAMHGEGLFQWPDGRIYYGGFNQGKKHGKGTYMWPNGQAYQGEFKNDECNGAGVLNYPDGKRFEGGWKDGKKHGSGHYSWPNGSRYFVNYVDGKQHGTGQMDSSQVSVEQMKLNYASLGKKTRIGQQMFM